jgi:hypothetical protein
MEPSFPGLEQWPGKVLTDVGIELFGVLDFVIDVRNPVMAARNHPPDRVRQFFGGLVPHSPS